MPTGATVTLDELKQSLLRVFRANLRSRGRYRPVPFVRSAPGVGKSAVVREVAAELGLELIDLRLSTKSVLDLAGVPYRHTDPETGEEQTRWARPDFARSRGGYVLFLDELTSAVPAVQAAAYEIVLDRRVGGHPLPDDVVLVAAGNRIGDRGVVYEVPVPLRNRLVHYEVEPDLDGFLRYGMRVGLDESVLAFLRYRPELLLQMPVGDEMAFPTPRSWEYLSVMLREGVEWHDVAGVVGAGAATEFEAFRRLRSRLPDVEALLLEGGSFASDEPSVQCSYAFSLAAHLLRLHGDPTRGTTDRAALVDRFVHLLTELPEELVVLVFLLVTDASNPRTRGLASALYENDRFMRHCVERVGHVVRGEA